MGGTSDPGDPDPSTGQGMGGAKNQGANADG
jgi:hypothetical protein